ncbi:MAG: bifunctional DNA primase/polymerase [Thermogutta sp.]|nr:bifunctional DNA primase/polymerase [Thermogutta sp.]
MVPKGGSGVFALRLALRTERSDRSRARRTLGYRVLPVAPRRKTPILPHWPTEATTDDARVRQWSAKWQAANLGIATGAGAGRGPGRPARPSTGVLLRWGTTQAGSRLRLQTRIPGHPLRSISHSAAPQTRATTSLTGPAIPAMDTM